VTVAKLGIARSAPDYYPGVVANTVLGGGYSARLNQEIRIKRGLSYGASSSLAPRRTTEMGKLAAEPASAEELKARKSVLIGGFGRSIETTDGLAGILGNLALYGLPMSEFNAYTAKVDAVTPDQVLTFAKTHLDPAGITVIIAGDAKAFAEPLKAKLPNLEVIPAAELDLDKASLRK